MMFKRRQIGLIRIGAAEVGRLNENFANQVHVHQAAAQAGFDPFQFNVRGDHRRQPGVVTVIKNLIELFLRPLRRTLRAEIINDQHRNVAHAIKHIVVGNFRSRTKRGAQMIQQIGRVDEHHFTATRQLRVGNGGGEMSLAAAVTAMKQ